MLYLPGNMQTLKSNKSIIPSSVEFDGIVADSIEITSKLFTNYFSSVYSDNKIPLDQNEIPVVKHFSYFIIILIRGIYLKQKYWTYLALFKKIVEAEPDDMPPVFLKPCLSILTKLLYYLLNLSISTEVFLNFWKNLILHQYLNPTIKIMLKTTGLSLNF